MLYTLIVVVVGYVIAVIATIALGLLLARCICKCNKCICRRQTLKALLRSRS